MEKQINTRQLSLIVVIFIVSLKLSVLPAITSDFASSNAYVSCFISLAIDFILIMLIFSIMMKLPNKTFFELIEETFSRVFAIIIYILLFIFFIFKSLVAFLELHDYYIASLFEDLNPIFFFLGIIFFSLFMLNKSFRNIGRTLQIFFWPMVIGLTFVLIYPVSDIELINLLPLFPDGIYPIFNGVFRTSLAYGDFVILFLLMGNIKYEKNSKKMVVFYVSSALFFVLNFFVVFIGSFGATTINQTLAIGELPLHNPHPSSIGRLEWLIVIIWTAILLFQGVLLSKCACNCLSTIIGKSDNKVSAYVVISILIAIMLLFYYGLQKLIIFAISIPFSILGIVFYVLLLAILIWIYIFQKKKNNIKVQG